ncbi:MAG: hypothetical protein IJZ29_03425 [Clostridia bacterium]|nr:hypothetical protein [Clostridia bacterium]
MKKKGKRILFFVLGIILFCVLVVTLYEVFFKVEPMKLAKTNVSEKGDCFFVDNTNDNVNLKVSSGTRENPYNLDGVHNEMKSFTLLIFKTTINNISEPSFVATIDGTEYQGVLELNPCDGTYVSDLQILLNNNSNISVVIYVNDMEFTFNPTNLNSNWGLDFDEALDIGLNNMKDIIEKLIENGKFNGECYVKVISDPSGVLDIYYYYIGIVDISGNIYSTVLDTTDGKILNAE